MPRLLVAFFVLVSLSACGPIIVDPRSNSGDPYSYQFNEYGCDTGYHSFETQREMCDALNSYDLNGGCASNSRARRFDASGCLGTFTDR